MTARSVDVVIVGGGHNALVAATYLARAGRRVVLVEANDLLGGAVAGDRVFPGVDARLSRYSYLVSLLPQVIMDDLGLDLELRSRAVASYTPIEDGGLLVERRPGPATAASFRAVTGTDEAYERWERLYGRLTEVAAVIAPTLTDPLPRAAAVRTAIGEAAWQDFVAQPIGTVIEREIEDDTVRGVVATDALIGTFADVGDPTLLQNRCFLYHLIGRGTGEWLVPVGGMGAVADALVAAARAAGVELITGTRVDAVRPEPGGGATVVAEDQRWQTPYVLAGCAPSVLAGLLGETAAAPEGSQIKINMLLRRLPRLRSGLNPETAFAGTLHLNQSYRQLTTAYATAAGGRIPDPLPSEVYCHTLTDPSILAPELVAEGWHTLTLFGLHTPAGLFRADPAGARREARDAALRALQSALAEPLEDCLARDADGEWCLETKTPLDLEAALAMPGGHIFHGELAWPWLSDDESATTPAEQWGVATAHPGVYVCGSGARRGGAVSGLGGHNAALAVLAER